MGLESSLVNGRFREDSAADIVARVLADKIDGGYGILISNPVMKDIELLNDSIEVIDLGMDLEDELEDYAGQILVNFDLGREVMGKVGRGATFSELVESMTHEYNITMNGGRPIELGINVPQNERSVLIRKYDSKSPDEFERALTGYTTINLPGRRYTVLTVEGNKKPIYRLYEGFEIPGRKTRKEDLKTVRNFSAGENYSACAQIELAAWYEKMGREVRVVD